MCRATTRAARWRFALWQAQVLWQTAQTTRGRSPGRTRPRASPAVAAARPRRPDAAAPPRAASPRQPERPPEFPRAGARRRPMEHPRPAPTGAPQGTDVKPTAPQKTIIERLHDAVPVLLPDSKLRNYWDALMFVVIFYNCNLTPVSITAPPASDIFRRLRRVDFAIDVLFSWTRCSASAARSTTPTRRSS